MLIFKRTYATILFAMKKRNRKEISIPDFDPDGIEKDTTAL